MEQNAVSNTPASRKSKKKLVKWIIIGVAAALVVIALILIIINAVQINSSYDRAIELLEQNRFSEAENAAREIRSRELREEYYDKRNQAASNRALELLSGGDIDQAFQLADIISDPLILREFNQQFYPVVYDRAIEMFDSGQEEDAREYMEKYASKSYEYMRKFNQHAGSK